MHALTKLYAPSHPDCHRPRWSDDGFFLWADVNPDDCAEPAIVSASQKLIEQVRELPEDDDAFGLIHVDLHHGNFYVHEGRIIAFDFDDSRYDWFAHDLAVPLFYALLDKRLVDGRKDFDRYFMERFMSGYNEEYRVDARWLDSIPLFLKMREFDIYLILSQWDESEYEDWDRRYMAGRRERLLGDVPISDLDFTEFA